MTAANAVVGAPFIFLVRALDVQVGSTQGEVSLSHGARAADFVVMFVNVYISMPMDETP